MPLTIAAGFSHGVESLIAPSPADAPLIASRLLMGGGGWAIAPAAAALCIEGSRRARPGEQVGAKS